MGTPRSAYSYLGLLEKLFEFETIQNILVFDTVHQPLPSPHLKLFQFILFDREQTVELISDEQLIYAITSTVAAHSIVWDNERGMYRFTMHGFDNLYLFQVCICLH